MIVRLRLLLGWLVNVFRSREDLILENLALRQQLLASALPATSASAHIDAQAVLGCATTALVGLAEAARRGHATHLGRVASSCLSSVLEMAFKSSPGRWPKASKQGNSSPNLPHGGRESDVGCTADSGELLKLGFVVSEPTVSRWLRRAPKRPDLAKSWLTFLRNHREAIAAMDFFTVPTITFGVLYCFFVISHGRRKVLRCSVTRNPNAFWIAQEMRETWPYDSPDKFQLFDRDSKFGGDVITAAREVGIRPVRTGFHSPWQNGIAERWVGSCRRDLLDHVIVLSERHLKRLIAEYVRYHHEDRTHLGLKKDTPIGRPIDSRLSSENGDSILSATWRLASPLRTRGVDEDSSIPHISVYNGLPATRQDRYHFRECVWLRANLVFGAPVNATQALSTSTRGFDES